MMGGKWIEYMVGDNTLAIANVGEEWKPSDQGTSAALEVENSTKRLASSEVTVYRSPLSPFETPCCHTAVVQDPDENKLIIHKLKPEDEKGVCK